MIECTYLFPDADWASAHVTKNTVRVNIQIFNRLHCIHIEVDKIATFLESIRREQSKQNSELEGKPSAT